MEDVFRFADDLGPAKIIHITERTTGLKAVLVVDNVAAGPSIGGVRMAPDVSTAECFRLARAMTLKNAAAGLPHGGGKAVIFADPRMDTDKKQRLMRAFACAVGDIKDFIAGPDMGTDETCMAWVRDENGRAVGLPPEIGGIPLDEIGATGFGLSKVAEVAAPYCDLELKGARLAVQGFGSVGRHAARFLADAGVVLVAAADSKGTLVDPGGLDVAALTALKREGKSVTQHSRGEKRTPEAIVDVSCDIWIPAARPDVLTRDNVDRLQTRLLIQGANIPVTGEAEAVLHDKGILSVPDFIANAGGVICGAVEYRGGTESQALAIIEEKVRQNTEQVLAEARAQGIQTRAAAVAMAERRVRAAMALVRWC